MKLTHIKDLVPDPANRRQHNPRNIGMIVDGLQAVGAARSIVIDEDNVILAGNGVTEAAAEAGITKVRVVEASGDEIIAVRRTGLSSEQKRALAIYDNRTAELAEWKPEQLQADVAAGLDLKPWFTEQELAGIVGQTVKAGRTDPDDVPSVRATSIQRGDLFELGPHRLLCGDSTSVATVARLMGDVRAVLFATDPPYAVGYSGGSHPSTKANQGAANKDKDWSESYEEVSTEGDGREFYAAFVSAAQAVAIAPNAAWYCWHASKRQAMLEGVWNDAGAFVHQQIIWAKSRAVLTYSVYMWAHEPCLFGWVKGSKPWVQHKHENYPSTVWQVPNSEIESKEHPTSKPVRLFSLPMEMHTRTGDACYEPFSGSGTQIIAAEQLGRCCFALELSPTFVQVAIDRWEAFTGQQAVKVGEAICA